MFAQKQTNRVILGFHKQCSTTKHQTNQSSIHWLVHHEFVPGKTVYKEYYLAAWSIYLRLWLCILYDDNTPSHKVSFINECKTKDSTNTIDWSWYSPEFTQSDLSYSWNRHGRFVAFVFTESRLDQDHKTHSRVA